MSNKTLNARVVQKHDIEENWLKATNFTPKAGEIIIYDADVNNPLPRIKIGDGVSNVNDLEFVGGNIDIATITTDEINEICGTILHTENEEVL